MNTKIELNKPGQDLIWGEKEIGSDKIHSTTFGDRILYYGQIENELRIANRAIVNGLQMPGPDLEWQRWVFKQNIVKVILRPACPDRPVVVKPENRFRLAEKSDARIYIRVPIFIQIVLKEKPENVIYEVPSVTLSKTWFGDFFQGDLCYWISSRAQRFVPAEKSEPHLVICPIHLINETAQNLDVENICLRMNNLTIYDVDGQLWTDETRTVFKGSGEMSQIEVGGKPPLEAKRATIRSQPREKTHKSFTAKTFATLGDLPGFGLFSKEE